MKKHLKFLAGTMLSFSATAFATPAPNSSPVPPPPHGPFFHHCPSPEEIKTMTIKHEQKLHDELKITQPQEGKWLAFTNALSSNLPNIKCNAPHPDTFIERVNFSENEAKEHHETIEKLKGPALDLYNILSPEQKKVMDTAFIPGLTFGHMPPHRPMLRVENNRDVPPPPVPGKIDDDKDAPPPPNMP